MEKNMTRTPVRRRRKHAAPIGGLFIIMAAIGAIAVLIFSVNATRKFIDNSDKKRAFEQMILPVLMFDPVPFESPTDLDPLVLLQSSLWASLLGEKRGSYPYDELRMLLVPASDVDVSAARLFGPDVKLTHQSFGNYETSYLYDEDTKTYHVPVTGQMGLYTPRVEEIDSKGDTLLLTVGYIPPDNIWTADVGHNEDGQTTADKHMIYQLTRNKNKKDYYLSAVRDVEGAGGIIPDPGNNVSPSAPMPLPSSSAPEEESGQSEQSSSQTESSSQP